MVSGNLARSGSISDCLRSDPFASASAEAPGPEIPTELKQTSQENSSVSSKPLSRRCCQERQLLGDPPRREPTLERPGSSRKDPGLKFKTHAQPRPDPRPRQGLWGSSHSPVPLHPTPKFQVMGHLLPGYVGWLPEDPVGDPRAPGESEQPQPARAHTRTHTQTHSRECVYVPNVGWENNGEPLGLRDHPPPSHQP